MSRDFSMWLTICRRDWHHFRSRSFILISLENLQLYASVITPTAVELLISNTNFLKLGNQDLQVSRVVPRFQVSESHSSLYRTTHSIGSCCSFAF